MYKASLTDGILKQEPDEAKSPNDLTPTTGIGASQCPLSLGYRSDAGSQR